MNISKVIGSLLCLLFLQTANADECADKIAELEQIDADYQRDANMRVLAQEHLDELLLERKRLDTFTAVAGAGLIGLSTVLAAEMGPAGAAFIKATTSAVGVIVSRNLALKTQLEDYKGRITLKGNQNERARANLSAKRTTLQATNCRNDDSEPVDDSEPEVQFVEPIGSGADPNQCVFCPLTAPIPPLPHGEAGEGQIVNANCPDGTHFVPDNNGGGQCVPD